MGRVGWRRRSGAALRDLRTRGAVLEVFSGAVSDQVAVALRRGGGGSFLFCLAIYGISEWPSRDVFETRAERRSCESCYTR